MKHSLTASECGNENTQFNIYALELDDNIVNIGIEYINLSNGLQNNDICINLNKKELHSFIGTLLHVQSKMKGGK